MFLFVSSLATRVLAAEPFVDAEPVAETKAPKPAGGGWTEQSLLDACGTTIPPGTSLVLRAADVDTYNTRFVDSPGDEDAGGCWIRGADLRIRSEVGVVLTAPVRLSNVERVEVTGLTFAAGLGTDRVRIVGPAADVTIVGNHFLKVGAPTTSGGAIVVTRQKDGRQGEDIRRVRIADNVIDVVEAGGGKPGEFDAYGIHVAAEAGRIEDVLIDNNELGPSCQGAILIDTGTSEAIAVNGAVTRFRITRNHVACYDNIGIDAMGGERQGPGIPTEGRFDHNLVESFRYSEQKNNNPGFGLYSDGARRLVFERNLVHGGWDGMEVSAEKAVASRDVALRDNLVVGAIRRAFRIGTWRSSVFVSLRDVTVSDLEVVRAGEVDPVLIDPKHSLDDRWPERVEFEFSRRSFIGGKVSAVELSARVRGTDTAAVTWDLKGLRRAVERGVDVHPTLELPEYTKYPTGCEIFRAKWPDDRELPKGCEVSSGP